MPAIDKSNDDCRQVSGVLAKGAQRARVQDQLKNTAMTKNAEDAHKIVAKHMANAALVLASFPVSKNDEFCIKHEELCTKNEEFCIKNDELCSSRVRRLAR